MDLSHIDLTQHPRKPPRCVECGERSYLRTGADAYPDEPPLHDRAIWMCACGAFVGCYPNTIMPRGRPGGPQTREIRRDTFLIFKQIEAELIGRGLSRRRVGKLLGAAVKANWPRRVHHFRFALMDLEQAEAMNLILKAVDPGEIVAASTEWQFQNA